MSASAKLLIPMSWRTEPPEWAAYVSSVVAIDRGAEVHIAIDMRSKHVECHTHTSESGEVMVTFYATPSTLGEDGRSQVVWPRDLGPWPEERGLPTLIINVGEGRHLEVVSASDQAGTCTNTACPHRYVGRYDVHVALVRRVDWQGEDVQEVPCGMPRRTKR